MEYKGEWKHIFTAQAIGDETFEVLRRVNRDFVELQIVDRSGEQEWIDPEHMVMTRQVHVDGGYRNLGDSISGFFHRKTAPTFAENYMFYREHAITRALQLRNRHEDNLVAFDRTSRALKECER